MVLPPSQLGTASKKADLHAWLGSDLPRGCPDTPQAEDLPQPHSRMGWDSCVSPPSQPMAGCGETG